ncbi:PREDICTED: F-box/LRR-repeat protein At4g14096-like [Camelina sativa]|uniref:F-box/LRR-repeat protein At4g14096-like n=1 Tax=Camelina sativa TaxID=90675 RepID=A0ABM1QXB9_CAMSA|nr:PREDICTED: F-box/LRR-repeat protein At4g14096-like [Camelina sativa]XP_019091408.1 PREDICTED: F-box/LRR-repeat protein At4g14096-like [Camelina sativa]
MATGLRETLVDEKISFGRYRTVEAKNFVLSTFINRSQSICEPSRLESREFLKKLQGLLHRDGMKCQSGDKCLCKPWKKEDIPTCLSSSLVKVLTILKFGDIYEDEDMDRMMEQVLP